MTWTYLTHISPNSVQVGNNGNKVQETYKRYYSEAFNTLLGECIISEEDLTERIERFKNQVDARTGAPIRKYRINIDTRDERDQIQLSGDFHVNFLRSRFLENKFFKNSLIDHYKPLGYYVKGPIQRSENGAPTGKWFIDLCWN